MCHVWVGLVGHLVDLVWSKKLDPQITRFHSPTRAAFTVYTFGGPVWLNDRAFASDPKGRGFESQPVRFLVRDPWASCSHACASVAKQYNLVPVAGQRISDVHSSAGKVTAGLAPHHPCVAGFSGLSTYKVKAQVGRCAPHQPSSCTLYMHLTYCSLD